MDSRGRVQLSHTDSERQRVEDVKRMLGGAGDSEAYKLAMDILWFALVERESSKGKVKP